jgi:ribokinase
MAASSPLPHITVLGSLNMDLVSYVPHHPQPGETLTSNSFVISPGGKGANQAAACAKLSRSRPTNSTSTSGSTTFTSATTTTATADIRMLGAVGTDVYGETLIDSLSAFGVDVSSITRIPDTTTGVAIIVVDEPTGENRIMFSPGANYSILPDDVSGPTVFVSTNRDGDDVNKKTDLLVMQLEIPLASVVEATRSAHDDADIPVLLNAAPAPSTADAKVLETEVFPRLAHLVVNETEAAVLCGISVAEMDEEMGLKRAGKWFVDRGVGTVVITLGARGAFWMTTAPITGGGNTTRDGLVPAVKVAEVVDTTAAGDTFVGVYALRVAGSASNFNVEEAVRAAAAAAALTVQRKGAQSSIPWGDELVR